MREIYSSCDGGLPAKKRRKINIESSKGTTPTKQQRDTPIKRDPSTDAGNNSMDNPMDNSMNNTLHLPNISSEGSGMDNDNDDIEVLRSEDDIRSLEDESHGMESGFIVDDRSSGHDGYDGFWGIDSPVSTATPSPNKRKRKPRSTNQKHFWFVDQAFAIEPYEVRGSFGGSSRIYNISRRNYHDSTHLGEQLSRYIFKQSVPGEQGQDDNDNGADDNDAKMEELAPNGAETETPGGSDGDEKVDNQSDDEQEEPLVPIQEDEALGEECGDGSQRRTSFCLGGMSK